MLSEQNIFDHDANISNGHITAIRERSVVNLLRYCELLRLGVGPVCEKLHNFGRVQNSEFQYEGKSRLASSLFFCVLTDNTLTEVRIHNYFEIGLGE